MNISDHPRPRLVAGEGAFQLMIDAVEDYAIYMIDPDGRVMTWNTGASRSKGYSTAEILGRHYECFFPPEARAEGRPQQGLQRALAQGRHEEEGWRVRRDGTRFWAHIVLTAIHDPMGRHIGFAKVTRDLTERKARELELKFAKERAEAADRAKTLFLASMSHELRTPLHAILGFSELLALKAGESLKPSEREYVEYIERAGHQLLGLIENVLDLAKIEEGSVLVTNEPADAAGVVAECVSAARLLARKRDQTLAIVTPRTELFVAADPARLRQVLMNFVSNAAKYGHRGGRIELGCTETEDGFVEFYVEDDGPGIREEAQKDLFQPFQRLGLEASSIEGSGIGLAIARQFVNLMGGRVAVRSVPGEGSRFSAIFARIATPVMEEPAAGARVEPGALQGVRILYIEDNPTNLMVFDEIVAIRSRATLRTTSRGIAGVAMAQADRPDIIVTDIHLPDIDGFEVLKRLREDERTCRIPVVALSADAERGSIGRGISEGFDAYLTKPLQIEEILATLKSFLPGAESKRIAC